MYQSSSVNLLVRTLLVRIQRFSFFIFYLTPHKGSTKKSTNKLVFNISRYLNPALKKEESQDKIKKQKWDGNMKTIEIDQTYLRMDSQGFYKLDIREKLNMARLMVNLLWDQTKHF